MRHILVTGAGGSIGAALCRSFSEAFPRASFSLTDVEASSTEAAGLSKADSARISCDLSNPEACVDLIEAAQDSHGPIDLLINCAGIMEMRRFSGTSWEVGERLLNIDLMSPLRLMNLVVPGMLERGSGGVINVSSMAGVMPLRGCSYYGGAKAGLAMASENARLELEGTGVRILTVYPGPVRSELERNARSQVQGSRIAQIMPTGWPDVLAQLVVRAYRKNSARVMYPKVYGLANRAHGVATWITSRFSPLPSA